MKVKEESEKAGLNLTIQKTKVMASSPITSWQIDGETMETVTCFLFLDSKVTADGDWSHEIKRCLLLERKAMSNLDSILKSRAITLPKKFRLVKAMVFLVVMYGCESWTVQKTESWRIDAFELLCWTRLLRVPWTARWSNQSVLKEISPEYSLEGLTLKLKLQSFAHLMWRANTLEKMCWEHTSSLCVPWCWERLKAGGEGDRREWDDGMALPTQWTWVWANSGRWWRREAWHAVVHRATKSQTQLSNWTTTSEAPGEGHDNPL